MEEEEEEEVEGSPLPACTSFISLIKAGAVGDVKNEPKDMGIGDRAGVLRQEGAEGEEEGGGGTEGGSHGEQTGRHVKPSP